MNDYLFFSAPQLERDPLDGANLPTSVRRFASAHRTWWRKPLVRYNRRALPAELVVLDLDLRGGEHGVWMNSRGTSTGAVDLVPHGESYTTRREPIPPFVASVLKTIYRVGRLRRGCPDLVIWHAERERLRLVEVKGPGDEIRSDQHSFMRVARRHGVSSRVVAWAFRDGAA